MKLKTNHFAETWKYVCIFYHFSTLWWHRLLKSFLMEDKDMFSLHSQHRGCWSPAKQRAMASGDRVLTYFRRRLQGSFSLTWINLNPSIHYKMWDEIIHLFSNFNGAIVEFGNEYTIWFHTSLGMWLVIHAGIKVNPSYWKGAPEGLNIISDDLQAILVAIASSGLTLTKGGGCYSSVCSFIF